MSAVNTDAKVPTLVRGTNLINTGGSSSNNQVMRVKVNGNSHFVQIRLNRDGGYAAVVVQRNEIETQSSPTRTNPSGISKSKVDRPWVLFTVNADGERTYGGKGRSYNVTGEGQLGNLAGDLLPNQGKLETTTETQALAQIGTATVNGETVTLNQFQDLAFIKAKVLSKSAEDPFSSRQAFESGIADAFIPAQSVSSVKSLEVIPHNAENEAKVVPGETNSDAENNDPNASDGVNSIGQFAGEIGDKAEELVKEYLPKIKEAIAGLQITAEEIAQFDKLFENGGGDTIQNGMYPLDANYGNIRGQDYVTIDQFIYQPPRRDQILGTGAINPIENLTKGQQRITPLKKFVAMVKLPMPNNITDSNAVSWGDDAMNNMSAAVTSAVMRNPGAGLAGGVVGMINPTAGKLLTLGLAGFDNKGIENADGSQDASFDGKMKALAKMLQTEGGGALLKTNMGAGILGMLGVNVSPESLLSRGFGVIPNSNTELLFNNVTLRDFQFSWRMSPRDEKEALEVKRIIRFFKQGMAAKTMANQAGMRSIYLGAPNVFRLQYRTTGGRIIEGVNRIKPCAVVGTAVNYTPDGQWSAYDKGQPVSCTLSIQMKELEPVYATDYSQKVIESRRSGDVVSESFEETETVFDGGNVTSETRTFDLPVGDGDLYSIRPTEVGY